MSDYTKKLERMIADMVPWKKSRRERYRGRVKPGEIKVFLEPGEKASNPLFAGANISRET